MKQKRINKPDLIDIESKELQGLWQALIDELDSLQQSKLTAVKLANKSKWIAEQRKLNPVAKTKLKEIISKHKDLINKATIESSSRVVKATLDNLETKPKIKLDDVTTKRIDENEKLYNYIYKRHTKALNDLPNKASMNVLDNVENHIEQLYKGINKALSKELPRATSVVYKNGRIMSFKSYNEMRIRTDINTLASDTLEQGAKGLKLVLFLCNSLGDCAEDHAKYQGQVYVLSDYESIVDQKELKKYQNFVKQNKILFLEDIKDKPVFLSTRPNCRHYFMPITLEQAQNKTSTLKALEMVRGGSYDKEKYDVLKEQRLLERQIRQAKYQATSIEKLLKVNQDSEVRTRLLSDYKLARNKVKRYQADIRKLVDTNPHLKRLYKRESSTKMAYDLGYKLNNKGGKKE